VAKDPISAAVKAAQPGDLILLSQGLFRRCGPFPSGRVGGPAVVVQGQGSSLTQLLRDTTVGSTDTINLGVGDHDTYWKGLYLQADDRAGIKTVSGVGPNHGFEDITLSGIGYPADPSYTWKDDSKWGIHAYDTAGWTETNVNVWNIYQEHGHYYHNIKGDHTFTNGSTLYCGRTAFQFVNRMTEGSVGVGNITIKNHFIKDVCLEQGGGGSAMTFAGGMPTSNILLDTVTVQLGCDAALQPPFNANITGALVVSNPQESAPGKGDGAWPGGVGVFAVKGCTFTIGSVYHGSGSAIRSAIKLDCPSTGFFFDNTTVTVTRDPTSTAVALEVTQQAGPVHFTSTVQMLGAVNYRGEKFQSWSAFKAAHPECFS
jgi:hypothetical protein